MAASDRVRFGMIGIGMQGSGLLANSIELPGVECVAACDLYDGRHTLAKEIVRPDLPTTRRYHELLENKEIDCIVAAVPDHWHKQIVVDAVSAGKDIYIEKPMSHTAEEGVEMVAAAKKNGRIVQVGSQRVSSVICAKAKELVAQGVLGDLMLVEGYARPQRSHRGLGVSAADRPFPADARLGHLAGNRAQAGVRSPDLCPLALLEGIWHGRGRRSAGPPGERNAIRAGHQRGAQARHGHGRDPALEGWPQHAGRALHALSVRRSSGLYAAQPGNGDARNLSLPGLEGHPGTDRVQPDLHAAGGRGHRTKLLRVELSQGHAGRIFQEMAPEHDAVPGKEPAIEGTSYRSVSWDEVKPHLWNYFQAVKTRKPVVEDAVFGHHAALACHMANQSYFRKSAVTWDEESKTIKS